MSGQVLSSYDLWVIAVGALVAVSCALTGCFLVLRKMSMLGDALSHSVLFGVVVGFLLSGSRSGLIVLPAAVAAGLFTSWGSSILSRGARMREDASIGVVYTTLFAAGLVLIAAYAGTIDLDLECVLYGELALTPYDQLMLSGVEWGPRAVWIVGGSLCTVLALLAVGFRKLALLSFDPPFASAVGIRVSLWHYLLMAVVSLTTVASFEAVGAILVVAMMVVPACTAYLFARSIGSMLTLAVLSALAAVVLGVGLVRIVDGSLAAAIVLAAAAQYALALMFSAGLRMLRHRSHPPPDSAVRGALDGLR